MNINDERAFFSNWGKCVTVFAPGLNITAAWIYDRNSVRTISGTSMASPHVCGVAALILGVKGEMTPDALKSEVASIATRDVLKRENLGAESPNLLLFNGAEKVSHLFRFEHLVGLAILPIR